MATIAVAAGELAAKYAAGADGDTYNISGLQSIGTLNISKEVHFVIQAGAQIRGRLVWKPGGEDSTVDGLTPFPTTPQLDGSTGPAGVPSWTIGAARATFRNVEMVNGRTNIGFAPINDTTFGHGDNYLVEYVRVHAIGKVKATGTVPPWASSDQPVQRKDGQWVGNHDHGIYDGADGGRVRQAEVYDCSDRGIQLRGATNQTTEKSVLVRDCGEGLIFGDLGAANCLTNGIYMNNQVASRACIESYLPGGGNVASGFAWNTDGRTAVAAAGVTTTAVQRVNPEFDYTTGKLSTGSPALTYGPDWVQPTPVDPGGGVVPVCTANPTTSGQAIVGGTLTATPGVWNPPATTTQYQWQRCAADGTGCVDIAGQTAPTYAPVAADVGHQLRVKVTGTVT